MKTKNSISLKLKSIIENGENQKVEFKEGVSSSLDKEIVAFANSSGGKIYIGITDKGKIKGISVTNELKNRIQDIAKNCDPEIPISIQEIRKDKVLVVAVKSSREKPHRCHSGFYIRAGVVSQKLTTEKIKQFMVKEGLMSFDKLDCKKFDYKKHFDKKKLFSFLDKAKITYDRRNFLEALENLKVSRKEKSKVIFNNAGALFFSKNLDEIHFHAKISCALFKGLEKRHVLDRKMFNEDILSNIEKALSFLENHLRLKYEIIPGEIQRREILEIPRDALREAIINAVTHRDYLDEGIYVDVEIYDDRVEVSNFGGLPKGLSRREFGKKSVPRNRLIAELMLRIGHIEKMGTGIKKMRGLVKEAGLKPIKFDFTQFTTVIFPRRPASEETFYAEGRRPDKNALKKFGAKFGAKFGTTDQRAYKLLKILSSIEGGLFSTTEFAQEEKRSSRSIEKDIQLLKKEGLISTKGGTKTRTYKVTEKYKKLKKKL